MTAKTRPIKVRQFGTLVSIETKDPTTATWYELLALGAGDADVLADELKKAAALVRHEPKVALGYLTAQSEEEAAKRRDR